MATRSTKKTPTRGGRAARTTSKPVTKQPAAPESTASWKTDIVGVVVIVVGLALLLAVILGETAVVAAAASSALLYSFGVGAYLFPILLILYGATFFFPVRVSSKWRVALGLLLILWGAISLIALATPYGTYLSASRVQAYGGYVGGASAWALVNLVGVTIAAVIMVGIVIVGLLITGFSISDFIRYLWERHQEKKATRDILASAPQVTPTAKIDAFDTPSRRERKQQAVFADDDSTVVTSAPADGAQETIALAEGDAVVAGNDTDDTPGSKKPSRRAKKAASSSGATDGATIALGDEAARETADGYTLPDIATLALSAETNPRTIEAREGELQAIADTIVDTLGMFGVTSRSVGWVPGPTVTLFKLEIAQGTRLNRITALADDLALALAAPTLRILAPIPGEKYVGIEVPNSKRSSVTLGDALPPVGTGGPLTLAIGKDVSGESITGDLARMPHLLVGGTTGSGKSVALNTMLMSILMRATPTDVRLILVDPKRVEMSQYNDVPHLYVPVVTEAKEAASALAWACAEMDRRLKILQKAKVKDIMAYEKLLASKKAPEWAEKMPYLVIVIDELADLMMVAAKEVEASIARLAGLARAAGIHMIVATQRPEANVITGLIKANIANRIAFSVATGMDSRIILDQPGAEKLTGLGDMLFSTPAWPKPKRIQGCFVSEKEIIAVTNYWKEQGVPEYHTEILKTEIGGTGAVSGVGGEVDPLMWDAAEMCIGAGFGSTSAVQRRFQVGYARAGRIMDMMQERGIVGPPDGSKPREVLIDLETLAQMRFTSENPDDELNEGSEISCRV